MSDLRENLRRIKAVMESAKVPTDSSDAEIVAFAEEVVAMLKPAIAAAEHVLKQVQASKVKSMTMRMLPQRVKLAIETLEDCNSIAEDALRFSGPRAKKG